MSSWWWEQWSLVGSNGTTGSSGSKDKTCFNSTQNTVLNGVQFGGVPVVLLLNFSVFLVLLILFSIIRRKFWDYGRLALVADKEGVTGTGRHRYRHMSSCVSNGDDLEYEMGFCSWLPFILRMDDEKIKARCGSDAVHYLSFQRHLVILLLVITVTSLSIILPVNLTGDLLGNNPESFGRTTIGNLQKGNDLLWLHTVFAVLYLALTVVLLRHHTSQMKGMGQDTARNTLFVTSLPKTATEDDVKTHFIEAYPSCRVCAVNIAYDVAKLMHLDKERVRAGKNLRYYERVLEKTGQRETIYPRLCGYLCCCAKCDKVDAIHYYSTKEKDLLEEVRQQVEEVPQRPLGLAFVTLQTEAMAKYILKDFNALDCSGAGCCRQPQHSSKSASIKVRKWRVSFAPHPKNVYWDHLSVQGFSWFARYAMLNFLLFFLLTFLTTPTIIINTMDKFNVTKPIRYLNSPIVSQFFPTFLLWCFSALLPTIVYYSTLGEAHWSRSSEQLSMMHKLYFFLLFMVLILPSLGLTSLALFFRWLFDKEFLTDGKLRFECVFLPDQGSFFVNYVIAAGLVGSAMDLMRLPGLLLYTICLAFARSAAERKYVKQNQAYEFEYGAMYGWILCVFTVIMAYSVICPIIVPFGLLYMTLKHLVDKHNLYFAYLPTRLDRQVHLKAVNQALAAPIICLIWLYFFSVLRTGFWAPTSLFTLVVLVVTILICLSYTCFGHFQYLSPHNYVVREQDEDTPEQEEENTMVYVPRVLNPKSSAGSPKAAEERPSYGSTEGSPTHSPSPENDNVAKKHLV
ncbi:CSC1-like protein 1 [Hippocampus comes]|uniref:Transmembrane protein 63A n=1 Tax=Hippocampus comes TaxID=109280 RepID=A0A3Q2YZB4_HIPCM|nr:PREDICTED: CSC1-like protein 1 [Hippocampus comes]XP_019738312.1 PREDICTED: CSC1-like protein 1 [Hippocampus comes]XP_019738313.1 PREDICTED: CSC1-like protein 1 [Hippocampus comes]XP_019738314.1 PREDICTED: CSC1-like protein 1 [Hippocampus comes]XP_019738315.1 PREDICTED: CSC1-like protein 1 [Hippocampus comes]XP_019738316.1 PREDICTED: CSC1-like protein 1 [Hippocampus comes]